MTGNEDLMQFTGSTSYASISLLAVLLAVCAVPAAATDGYFLHGLGVKAKGAGGAGIAFTEDAVGIATNPALAATLGHRLDLGVDLFSPSRDATIEGNAFGLDGIYDGNGRDLFVMGEVAYVRPLGDRLTFGIAAYANGGMNTEYTRNPFAAIGGKGPVGVDLMQGFVAPTLAYRLDGRQSVGISLVGVVQAIDVSGIGAFASSSSDPDAFSDQGSDLSVGAGIKIGYHWQATDRAAFGAFYQSRLRTTAFDDYSGLFAGGGAFDVPASWGVGAALGVTSRLTLVGDVRRIDYNGVPSVGNRIGALLDGAPFGADGGPGFGWDSITTYKIGAVFKASDRLNLRAGYSQSGNPIPDGETFLNILAPAVVTDHYTIGATYEATDRIEFSAYVMHAPRNRVRGARSVPVPFGGGETDLSLAETSIGFGIGKRF